MHGTTQSLVKTSLPCKYLGQRSINQEFKRQRLHITFVSFFNDAENAAIKEIFHDPVEGIIIQLLDGRKPLGQDFAMGTVRSEDVVVDIQLVGHAYSCSFLSDGEVGRPWMGMAYPFIFICGLYQV